MVFHKDAPENEKLVLKRSVLGLGRVMYFDVARARERERERLRPNVFDSSLHEHSADTLV